MRATADAGSLYSGWQEVSTVHEAAAAFVAVAALEEAVVMGAKRCDIPAKVNGRTFEASPPEGS
jgi:hypothetical protein